MVNRSRIKKDPLKFEASSNHQEKEFLSLLKYLITYFYIWLRNFCVNIIIALSSWVALPLKSNILPDPRLMIHLTNPNSIGKSLGHFLLQKIHQLSQSRSNYKSKAVSRTVVSILTSNQSRIWGHFSVIINLTMHHWWGRLRWNDSIINIWSHMSCVAINKW